MPDPYDVLTIAAIVDELAATIGNGRIQRIGLADARTIGAEIYAGGRRHYLLASTDDHLPRLRLAAGMPSLDSALLTPFGLLLRKYVRGGIILGIDQPPLERVVRISIAKRLPALKNRATPSNHDQAPELDFDDLGQDEGDEIESDEDDLSDITHLSLYVELMGRHSNLILVDDEGIIMESAKRVTPAMSRVRVVLPRHTYEPPPPPERRDPRFITEAEAARFLASVGPTDELSRAFVNAYRGISPVMAREIAYRATGHSSILAGELGGDLALPLTMATRALLAPLETADWQPQIYFERHDSEQSIESSDPVAFSAVPMEHLAAVYQTLQMASISEAAARAEQAAQRPSPQRHAQRRQRLLDAVASAREKAERRLTSLDMQTARAADAERLKQSGELIYANLWQIGPGQTELVTDGQTIRLDPAISASENAQAYFEQYRKAQSADAQLPGLAAESEAEIAYLDQLSTFVAQAPGFAELEALSAEWAEHANVESSPKGRRKLAPRRPKALLDAAGNSVYIGRSGPQNDLVTFEIAAPDDTWLHARGVGGAHVIIRWRNPAAPEDPDTVAAAAALAAWYSAARESGGVEVDVAKRRHVRKIKGGRPGMVTYRNERTIRVQPAPEEELRDIFSDR